MIKRNDVDTLGKVENGLRVVVVANPNVIDYQCGTVTLGCCQHAKVDAQSDRSLLCHSSKLTAADDPNRGEVIDR